MSRGIRTIPQPFLTSAAIAKQLGVGVSTIKRWADEGRLEFTLTAGGHRRFRMQTNEVPFASTPADLDRIGDTLREIGARWERGEIGVEDEHRESHRIAEELDRLRGAQTEGPLALLACPPGERHELPLRLVRLALEWRGWRTILLGADTPWEALARMVAKEKPQLVALSARAPIDAPELDALAQKTRVAIGGSWARGPVEKRERVLRFRSLRAFDRWLGSNQALDLS